MRHGIEDPKEQVLPVFLPRCVVLVPEGQDALFQSSKVSRKTPVILSSTLECMEADIF